MRSLRTFRVSTALIVLAAGLAGCGGDSDTSSAAPTGTVTATAAAGVVTATDPWVKVAPAGSMMTAVFGTLKNSGSTALTVVSASTDASDRTELHEVVMKDGQSVMQPKAGGLEIPAQGEHVLQPGGDHIMVMDLKQPIEAGDQVTVTLTFDDGTSTKFSALAKETAAGEEKYTPAPTGTHDMADMPGMG